MKRNFRRISVLGPLKKAILFASLAMHTFPFLLAPLSEVNITNYPVLPAFLKLALFCMPGLNIDMVLHEMNEKRLDDLPIKP